MSPAAVAAVVYVAVVPFVPVVTSAKSTPPLVLTCHWNVADPAPVTVVATVNACVFVAATDALAGCVSVSYTHLTLPTTPYV